MASDGRGREDWAGRGRARGGAGWRGPSHSRTEVCSAPRDAWVWKAEPRGLETRKPEPSAPEGAQSPETG